MIIRNGVQPKAFYKGDDPIKAIYRGEDLVWTKSPFPSWFQRCEWIMGKAKAYIPLGFTVDYTDAEVEISAKLNQQASGGGSYIIGCDTTARFMLRSTDGSIIFLHQTASGAETIERASNSLTAETDFALLITVSKTTGKYSTELTEPEYLLKTGDFVDNVNQSAPLYLFARKPDDSNSYDDIFKLYNVRFRDINAEYDFIPGYRTTDGNIGVLDTLTNTFYPSVGEFTKGQDVN